MWYYFRIYFFKISNIKTDPSQDPMIKCDLSAKNDNWDILDVVSSYD